MPFPKKKKPYRTALNFGPKGCRKYIVYGCFFPKTNNFLGEKLFCPKKGKNKTSCISDTGIFLLIKFWELIDPLSLQLYQWKVKINFTVHIIYISGNKVFCGFSYTFIKDRDACYFFSIFHFKNVFKFLQWYLSLLKWTRYIFGYKKEWTNKKKRKLKIKFLDEFRTHAQIKILPPVRNKNIYTSFSVNQTFNFVR